MGFRAFIRRIAEEWQLRGWVRNLPDGRVEALVKGADSAMNGFELQLRKGPFHGTIEKIEVAQGDPESIPAVFEIRKDGR